MGVVRLILAISVVIAHTDRFLGFDLVGGRVAVQAFYIMSGFYMTLVLNEKYVGLNNSYKLFITNRLIRLYPVYWVVVLLTICYSCVIFLMTDGVQFSKLHVYLLHYESMGWFSLIFLAFTNLFLVFQDLIMFLGISLENGSLFFTKDFSTSKPMLFEFLLVPQAWTLGVEILFYLIAPFIVRQRLIFVGGLFLGTLLLRIVLWKIGLYHDPWIHRFFPTALGFFLLGTFCYHGYKRLETKKGIPVQLIYYVILFIILIYGFLDFSGKEILFFLLFTIGVPFIFIYSKHSRLDRKIGELSYPVYIAHMLVLLFLNHLHGMFQIKNYLSYSGMAILLTVVFAYLLNELVAVPIEKYRQSRVLKNAE